MSELPDRTPDPRDQDGQSGEGPAQPPTALPSSEREPEVSFGYDDEERTAVHETATPPAADPDITGFTPAPRERTAVPPAPEQPPIPDVAPAAQVAAQAVPRKVNVRNRGRMRRRLRYLRRVRELGYRDLGGLVFELRRARADNEVLVGAKVDALWSIDQELRALEHGLRDFRNVEELHEPGVSVCLRCGALHGSDANFCPQCGIRVDQHTAAPGHAEPATVVTGPGDTGSIAAGQTTGTGRRPR
ncbi:zinc ribbon domain-containing protein [Patulibacter minatonensis]|uniref:zinc ribbon domain-containing protein n=1 Tax=Patulibacter minatonensis TaxID=298163 RepID=UPI00047B9FF8|nr:zinc ribbon domain-containing protein [Patulibacter minatonensis]